MNEHRHPEGGVRKHVGGCHCGAVRFEATFDVDKAVNRCNCTLCTKRGASTAMMKPDAFRLLSGEGDLTSYAWGAKTSEFLFCKRCGIAVFGKGNIPEIGGAYVSVNVNCLDDVDPARLKATHWDGRHDGWDKGSRQEAWPVHR
jgi:hypothetical protein